MQRVCTPSAHAGWLQSTLLLPPVPNGLRHSVHVEVGRMAAAAVDVVALGAVATPKQEGGVA
eukprot:121691-Chlamydomonas_euryale.AAC.1